jgi:hypothetical protein
MSQKDKNLYFFFCSVNSISRSMLLLPFNEAFRSAPPRLRSDELPRSSRRCRAGARAALVECGRIATQGAGALCSAAAQPAPRCQYQGAAAHAQRSRSSGRRLPPLSATAAATATAAAAANESASGDAQVSPLLAERGEWEACDRQQDNFTLALNMISILAFRAESAGSFSTFFRLIFEFWF